MCELEYILKRVPEETWEVLSKESSQKNENLHELEWWHNKYYIRTDSNNGLKEQISEHGYREIPYKRQLFYPSPKGRFSLGSNETVAYFSNDFAINCCETIEQFRSEENLKWEDFEPYLNGKSDPDKKHYGYPISIKIKEGSKILDLTYSHNTLIQLIVEQGNWKSIDEFWETVIISRSDKAKRETQCISKIAKEKGFKGIIYKSVRTPRNISFPEQNIVLFDKNIAIRSNG